MEFEKVIKERFSTRKFTNQKVEKEKLDKILEAARIAPTARNLQNFKVYVVESKEGLEKIDKATGCRFNAQTVLIIADDKENGYWHGDHSFIDIDASIITTHLMLAATNVGVNNIWIGNFEPKVINEEFNLPKGYVAVSLLPIGYKTDDFEPSPLHSTRKSIEEIVEYK